MPFEVFPYSRPFKFVLVGDCGSGKTALIREFLSESRPGEQKAENEKNTPPTLACECHTTCLNTTIEQVCEDGSSTAVTLDDISHRLWHKTYSNSFLASQSVNTEDSDLSKSSRDISWNDISVRLHQSNRKMHSESSKAPLSKLTRKHLQKHDTTKVENNVTKSQHFDYASLIAASQSTEIEIDIWDTSGDKNCLWRKWYACSGADAVLLCVPLSLILNARDHHAGASPCLKNLVGTDGLKKLHKLKSDELISNRSKSTNYRTPPVLLIGTKSDQLGNLSPDADHVSECKDKLEDSIGLDLAIEIGCSDFIRCSSFTGTGVDVVFETAIAISLSSEGKYQTSMKKSFVETGISDAESSMANEVKDPTYFKIHRSQDNYIQSSKKKDKENSTRKKYHNSDNNDIPDSIISGRLPRIHFPPPPLTSPPSTGPPSTCSPKTNSSSSLESVSDFINDALHGDIKSQKASTILCKETLENNVVVEALPNKFPTPTPRIRKKENGNATEKTSTETIPRPKMPSLSLLASKRRTPSKQKRREGIFIKFLQAN